MGGSVIRIEGLKKTLDRIDIKRFKPQIQKAFNDFGDLTETVAKLNAPRDEGRLASAIHAKKIPLGTEMVVNVNYASYLEFGTKRFAAEWVATLPAEWQKLAASTKGKTGGSFEEFVLRLTEWVHRKGLGTGFAGDIGVTGTYSIKTRKRTGSKKTQQQQDKQAAYAIALKILREGIPAQPYLYPAVNENTKKLLDDLKKIKV